MNPQNTPSAIRWGIVGCGDVCEVKSGPAFQKATGSELVAVMRRDAAKARDFASRHGVPKWHSTAPDLIHDPAVDAVYIATPLGNHRDLALAVAEAGKPCYVEKPMARTHAECLEMIQAFRSAGTPLFVAYYRRCLPRFTAVKDLIDRNQLGRLTTISYHLKSNAYRTVDPAYLPWRLQPEHSGGGLLWDLGSHLLDLLDHLLGPLQDVSGHSENVSQCLHLPDQTRLTFRTADGAQGEAHWDFASETSTDSIQITGEHGSVQLSCFGNEPVVGHTTDGPFECILPNPPHVHQPLVQTLVDELRNLDTKCPSTGTSAARTSAIIDHIGQSKKPTADLSTCNEPGEARHSNLGD